MGYTSQYYFSNESFMAWQGHCLQLLITIATNYIDKTNYDTLRHMLQDKQIDFHVRQVDPQHHSYLKQIYNIHRAHS